MSRTVVDSGLQVFAQNLETVERLTHVVRDRRAGYRQTLDLLAHAKAHRPDVLTKTSLMLGLGESEDEVLQALRDIRAAQVDIVTLGQYLHAHRQPPAGGPLRAARGLRPPASGRAGTGLFGSGGGADGALQLPRRPRVPEGQLRRLSTRGARASTNPAATNPER